MLFALPLLLACTAPTDKSSGDSSSAVDSTVVDSGTDWYDPGAPTPSLTADEFTEVVKTFVDYGLPNPLDIALDFNELMSHGDELCPGSTTDIVTAGPEGCTTPEGYFFSGIGTYAVGEYLDEAETIPLIWNHIAEYELGRPTGTGLWGGGEIKYIGTRNEDGSIRFDFTLFGTWVDTSLTNWLGQSFSAVYSVSGSGGDLDRGFTISGGLGVGDLAVRFNDTSFLEAGECPWFPTGSISLRDSAGYWYDWQLSDDCDPCGTLTFQATGEELGDVCVDLSEYGKDLYLRMLPR